jgi:hypothetical protein
MKTPEELADEYTINVYDCLDDSLSKIKTMRVSKYAFLAGYQAAAPQWISVKDRLPEIGKWVLINGPEVCQRIEPPSASWKAEYAWSTNHESYYHAEDITHWMPLPAAPKEEV